MTTYYDLLADQESIRMAQGGLEYAEKLLADNQSGSEEWACGPSMMCCGAREVALRQQALLAAQNTFFKTANP